MHFQSVQTPLRCVRIERSHLELLSCLGLRWCSGQTTQFPGREYGLKPSQRSGSCGYVLLGFLTGTLGKLTALSISLESTMVFFISVPVLQCNQQLKSREFGSVHAVSFLSMLEPCNLLRPVISRNCSKSITVPNTINLSTGE